MLNPKVISKQASKKQDVHYWYEYFINLIKSNFKKSYTIMSQSMELLLTMSACVVSSYIV